MKHTIKFLILLSISLLLYTCTTVEDEICSTCIEEQMQFIVKNCGIEDNITSLEWMLVANHDSLEYKDTVRANDHIAQKLKVDSTITHMYLSKNDSLYDGLSDTTHMYVWETDSSLHTYTDSIKISYFPSKDSTTYINVYWDSVHYDSSSLFYVIYEYQYFDYDEPLRMGDTLISEINPDSVLLRTSIDSSIIDGTFEYGNTFTYDTSTYSRYIQQNWKCIRQ